MIARAAAGFALGAALAGVCVWIRFRETQPAPGGDARREGGSRVAAPTGDGESEALLAEIAALEQQGRDLRAEEARLAAGIPAPGSTGPGAGERRRGLARRAGAEARRIADGDFLETPEGQAFSVEFQRWIQALCEETGLPPGEATFSPDGLWAFFLEAFASADPPLPDDARRAFEERLAAFRGEWDAYAAARPGLTPMERARETSNFWPALYEAVGDTFPEPFVEAARAAFDDFNLATPTESKWFSGQRSQVQEQISRSISADLGLDDRRQAALGPLVDAFMRRTEEANRLGIDGSRESRRRVARAQYDAMLLLQKDIAATLSLDAGQAGRVRDWETLYGFQLLE